MRSLGFGALVALAACGVDETHFIPDYADLYCDTVMSCSEPALLLFDGIETKDDCLAIVGPAIESEVLNCDYDPKSAKRCLKGMEGMGCPGEGQTVDDVLPLDCAQVSSICKEPVTEPTGTGTATGTATGGTTTGGTSE